MFSQNLKKNLNIGKTIIEWLLLFSKNTLHWLYSSDFFYLFIIPTIVNGSFIGIYFLICFIMSCDVRSCYCLFYQDQSNSFDKLL